MVNLHMFSVKGILLYSVYFNEICQMFNYLVIMGTESASCTHLIRKYFGGFGLMYMILTLHALLIKGMVHPLNL